MLVPPPSADELRAWFNFFTTLMQFATPILLALSTAVTVYFSKRAAAKTEEVAATTKAAVEDATKRRDVVDEKLVILQDVADKTKDVTDKTHTLVNGKHGIALKTILDQAIRLAALTKLPADIAAVDVARQNVDDHQRKQDYADSK